MIDVAATERFLTAHVAVLTGVTLAVLVVALAWPWLVKLAHLLADTAPADAMAAAAPEATAPGTGLDAAPADAMAYRPGV